MKGNKKLAFFLQKRTYYNNNIKRKENSKIIKHERF